jgi:hypothetical protein
MAGTLAAATSGLQMHERVWADVESVAPAGRLTRRPCSGHCGDMSKRDRRRRAIRAIGWTAGGFWLLLFFGLTDLSVPLFFQARPEFYEGYLIETGWGVLFTFFAGLPMCFLGARPAWISAPLVSAASGVTVLIAAVASAQPVQLVIVAALLLPAAAAWALAPSVRDSDREPSLIQAPAEPRGFAVRIPTLGLALVSLPPAIMYASEMFQLARQGEPEPGYTYVFDHYPIQAASVLVIPLATALLALRLPGWRPMMLLVASGTAWFGVVSIVHPNHLGSWGTAWGWTAVAWAVALSSLAFRWGTDTWCMAESGTTERMPAVEIFAAFGATDAPDPVTRLRGLGAESGTTGCEVHVHRVARLLADGASCRGGHRQLVPSVAEGHERPLEREAVDLSVDLDEAAGAEELGGARPDHESPAAGRGAAFEHGVEGHVDRPDLRSCGRCIRHGCHDSSSIRFAHESEQAR